MAQSTTPLDRLLAGYNRFRQQAWSPYRERWESLREGQNPEVMVIACSDSRVDPGQIFDVDPGEIFVVRNVAAMVPPYETTPGHHGVSAALEFAVQGVRCNSIHPGVIETPMLRAIFDSSEDPAETRKIFAAQQPSNQIGTPDDIAWGCVYLASDEAKFVSGAELSIDGALVAR